MVAGSEADTLYFNKDAISVAKEPKELFIVQGETHTDLYDHTDGVMPKLVDFFKEHLALRDSKVLPLQAYFRSRTFFPS